MDKESLTITLPKSVDPSLQLPDPTLLSYYRDLENRVYWINGEITDEYLDLVDKIIQWNREDKDIEPNERKPIRLLFSSEGGSLEVEETIVSMLDISETPIIGIAMGMVASAASCIYLACHRRYALPNTCFVFHQGGCNNIGGTYDQMKNFFDDYTKQIEKMEKFYIERTDYEEKVVKEKIQHDWYIRVNEALEKGVCHEIIKDIGIFL